MPKTLEFAFRRNLPKVQRIEIPNYTFPRVIAYPDNCVIDKGETGKTGPRLSAIGLNNHIRVTQSILNSIIEGAPPGATHYDFKNRTHKRDDFEIERPLWVDIIYLREIKSQEESKKPNRFIRYFNKLF